ncbi:hypothetical protein ACQPVP_03400 [Clostridium nigeriense]|uniref:hypothetical protein n=1 Tax=Clostridium nigeriense TaxID=1805470 RepID=UPI003D3482EC
MIGQNISGECGARNTNYSLYYTPLFETVLNSGTYKFNGVRGRVHFWVARMNGNEIKIKDFSLYAGVSSDSDLTPKVVFNDLTPWIEGGPYVRVVVDSTNNRIRVYGAGGNSNDSIVFGYRWCGHRAWLNNLDHVDIPKAYVETTGILPKPMVDSPTVTVGTNWEITSSRQRIYRTFFNKVDIDYYTCTRTSSGIVADTVIGTVSIKPKVDQTFVAQGINRADFTPDATNFAVFKILASNGNIVVVSGVAVDRFYRIKLDYAFTI